MRALKTVAVAALGTMTLLVASCGEDAAADSADRTTAVEHTYGTTTVDGTPTRIVAGTSQWVDALLEFGVQPVAYHSSAERGDERGLFPWQSDVAADAVELEASAATMSLPVEQIAAQNPDLILGSYTVTTRSDFDKLSQIAPTVPALGDAQVDEWEDQVTVLGEILGQQDRANEIITEAMLPNGGSAEQLNALPGFADLPAVREGGLAVVDYPTVVGFNTPSSTSVLYSLDRITPQLQAVAN